MRTVRQAPLSAGLAVAVVAALGITGCASASAPGAPKARASATRVVVSKARCAANRAAGTLTFLSAFGYDASAGILDVLAAKQLGYFSALCLNVDIVASSSAAVQGFELVSSGKATVTGKGSAADFLTAASAGANVVGVATFGDTSDYALLTQPSITNLRQLAGKTLAYHTTLPVAISEMLQRAGVDVSKVTQVNDTSYDPLLLAEGKFDALQAYRSNEPITLRAAHKAFREYVPSSYGVAGTFNVQLMNGTFVRQHAGAAADFLRAELHAFDYCVAHAQSCVAAEGAAASSAGITYDRTHNLAEWNFEAALAEQHRLPGAGVGVQTTAEWRPEAQALVQDHLLTKAPDLAKVENTTLTASLYRGAQLVWPGS
ncbi:MAG: thiamine biosynthesis protein [Acidimicrobiaceae bacterium]|nr:thiamine biosynthesis protein [Acidimicrobiaceae bacterium]